jgi:hypothetical protein
MYIEVDRNRVTVRESTDFGSLSVRVQEALSDNDIDSSLKSTTAGALVDGSAVIDISWLRSHVSSESSEVASRFEDMITFAARHGWVSAGGTHVLAHVDRRL